jgi:hypothetical protein
MLPRKLTFSHKSTRLLATGIASTSGFTLRDT